MLCERRVYDFVTAFPLTVEILICGGALATQAILYTGTLSLRVPHYLLLLSV